MATVVYGDYEPFEIDDHRADLVAYYRGEGATVTFAGASADESEQGEAAPPAKSANKGEWVDYAVSQGATQEDAEALTKDQLIEQFGSD